MPLGRTYGSWAGLLEKMINSAKFKVAEKERKRIDGLDSSQLRLELQCRGLELSADADQAALLAARLVAPAPTEAQLVAASGRAHGHSETLQSAEEKEHQRIEMELARAMDVLESAGGSGAKLQRVAQVIEDTIGGDDMNTLGVELLELPPEVYSNDPDLTAEFLLSQKFAEHTRIERLSREKLVKELEVRKALGSLTVESKLEELVKQRKSDAALDPKDANGKAINLKAGDVEHPTKEDKDKGKGIVDFRRRIAMLRLLPLKAIITTKRVLRAQHDQLRATARAHSHSPSLARLPRPTHAPR